MSSRTMFRSANDPKDLSVWEAHKEKLRELYLTEGKPLKQVASCMESCYGFPKNE